ncbi:MAG: single-stranded DNA-binding protein [Lachnospiraceae bacterium]|nr:single-stranded DNA-binding protein [Lachnospiraceae bacterium]
MKFKITNLNIAGLQGTVTSAPEPYGNIYGKSGVYALYMDVLRDSGTPDRILVIFQEDKLNRATLPTTIDERLNPEDEKAWVSLIKEGSIIEVTGVLQTHKNKVTGRTQLFVWADYIADKSNESDNIRNIQMNVAYIKGVIEKTPHYKVTSKGIHITEFSLRIPSIFTPGYYSYIPCITWQKIADRAKELKEGTVVTIDGRIQKRDYWKNYNDGTEKRFSTWEVSISKLDAETENCSFGESKPVGSISSQINEK